VPYWRMKLPATVLSFSVVLLLVCWSFEGFAVLGLDTDICILVSCALMLTYKVLKKLCLGSVRSSLGLLECEA
jgi:branched-subunit amino acid transport protein AzlD